MMADRAQGAISFTPIVTIAADSDADAVDAIHHNIKGRLGGNLVVTAANDCDKWFYAPNVIVLGSRDEELFGDGSDDNTDLDGASGDQLNGPNEAGGSAVTFTDNSLADCGSDKVYFLYIENTATSDISNTASTDSVYVTFDDNDSTTNSTSDAIEIASGEVWMSRLNGVVMDEIHIIAGQAKAAGATILKVRCTVVALIDDVNCSV